MLSFSIVPTVERYDRFCEFVQAAQLNEDDLIVTNEFIYKPVIEALQLPCDVLFQERYGKGEPSDEMIDALVADARKKDYRRIVAIGGGTVIDICKLLTLQGDWTTLELFERRVPIVKCRELIVIPTTCGTGSEVTNITIAELKSKKTKMGLAVPELFANRAVLIPELLHTLPYKFFATSSIDALIHAVESFVSPKSNCYSQLFAVRAMEMILNGYRQIASQGPDARFALMEDFLTASNFAGIAFGNTGVGAVHALSYPLGGNYHIPHGEANQLMFTAVFACYKSKKTDAVMHQLEEILARVLQVDIQQVWQELDALLNRILPRKPLKEYGMSLQEFPVFAQNVIETQQRLLNNNYAPLTAEDMVAVYQSVYEN